MYENLKKAMDLAKRTGDRILVFDASRPADVFALMSLEEYEKLMLRKSDVRGLTEDELLDRINRDIAAWKNEQENMKERAEKSEDYFFSGSYEGDGRQGDGGAGGASLEKTDRLGSFSPPAKQAGAEKGREKRNQWKIPSDRKESAEEIIEEDRQYLESIDF